MILFFVNRHNDIDHIAPIAYRLALESEKVAILSLNPIYDIVSDYRLKYLKENYNVVVDYVYSYYCPTMVHKFFGALIKNTYFQHFSKKKIRSLFRGIKDRSEVDSGTKHRLRKGLAFLFVGLFKKYLYWWIFDGLLKKYYYNEKWIDETFKTIKPSLLVFDFAARKNLLIVDPLILIAKKKGINIIFVPHGLWFFPPQHLLMSRSCTVFKDQNPDGIIVSYKMWAKAIVNNGVNPKKIYVLGSARFCQEWRDIMRAIIPNDSLPPKINSELRVLYVERQGDRHGHYKKIVQESLKKINQISFVHLLIQPATRSNKIHFDISDIPIESISYANSFNLCDWADIVICLSSIMFEVLLQNKVFINARFLHGESLISDEFDVGWIINSYEELEEALKKLYEDKEYRPYSIKNVDRFLTEMIYDDIRNRDVLGDYKKFMLEMAREYKR